MSSHRTEVLFVAILALYATYSIAATLTASLHLDLPGRARGDNPHLPSVVGSLGRADPAWGSFHGTCTPHGHSAQSRARGTEECQHMCTSIDSCIACSVDADRRCWLHSQCSPPTVETSADPSITTYVKLIPSGTDAAVGPMAHRAGAKRRVRARRRREAQLTAKPQARAAESCDYCPPQDPCRKPRLCRDGRCFKGLPLKAGTPCDDGDPMTTGETCDKDMNCIAEVVLDATGQVSSTVPLTGTQAACRTHRWKRLPPHRPPAGSPPLLCFQLAAAQAALCPWRRRATIMAHPWHIAARVSSLTLFPLTRAARCRCRIPRPFGPPLRGRAGHRWDRSNDELVCKSMPGRYNGVHRLFPGGARRASLPAVLRGRGRTLRLPSWQPWVGDGAPTGHRAATVVADQPHGGPRQSRWTAPNRTEASEHNGHRIALSIPGSTTPSSKQVGWAPPMGLANVELRAVVTKQKRPPVCEVTRKCKAHEHGWTLCISRPARLLCSIVPLRPCQGPAFGPGPQRQQPRRAET